MSNINSFFFAHSSFKKINVAKAMLLFFASIAQKNNSMNLSNTLKLNW